jgi:hypothetical protein
MGIVLDKLKPLFKLNPDVEPIVPLLSVDSFAVSPPLLEDVNRFIVDDLVPSYRS